MTDRRIHRIVTAWATRMLDRRAALRLLAGASFGAAAGGLGLSAAGKGNEKERQHTRSRRSALTRRGESGTAGCRRWPKKGRNGLRCEPCTEALKCVEGRYACVPAVVPQCARCEKPVCVDGGYVCVADPTSPCPDEAPHDAFPQEVP